MDLTYASFSSSNPYYAWSYIYVLNGIEGHPLATVQLEVSLRFHIGGYYAYSWLYLSFAFSSGLGSD